MSIDQETTDPVIVLGAKPEAQLPNVAPAAVVAANGAAEIALSYREKFGTKIIGMVPGKDLFEQEHIRESIKKAQPDELILLGTIHIEDDPYGYVERELGIDRNKVIIKTLYERNWRLARAIGWRRYVMALRSSLARGWSHPLMVALPDILTSRHFNWTGRSTGLNGILYSMERFPKATQIIAAGIGLQAGGHFNNAGKFKVKTAQSDQITMRHWVPACRPRVFTTDDAMSEIGKVPKWEGETFLAN